MATDSHSAEKSLNPFLNEFHCFLVCADFKNISKAAESLGVHQAGLSKMILKLESQLGQKLFVRNSRGLDLTDYGQCLKETLKETHLKWNESFQTHFQQRSGYWGTLKVGCYRTIAQSLFPRLIPGLIDQFPSLELETHFLTSVEVTRKVADLSLDLGFVINPVKRPDLIAKPIQQEFSGLWQSQSLKKPANENSKVLTHNPEMYMTQRFLGSYKDYRFLEISDYEVIADLVAQTSFLGLLPSSVAKKYGLELVKEQSAPLQLSLIYHRDKFLSPQRKKLIGEILKLSKAQIAD